MRKQSAGILLFRRTSAKPEVLLVHPGGPYWKNKDDGAWSIPKGEFADDESPKDAAIRELAEETGITGIMAQGDLLDLGQIKQAGGKVVWAWAVEQDFDPAALRSDTYELEWPPRSGVRRAFPEVDEARWFPFDVAKVKLVAGQIPFIERLAAKLDAPLP
jgi:predicted NUDIX family NTP pyrophosphohydrolase